MPKLDTVLIVTNSPYETVRNFSIEKNQRLVISATFLINLWKYSITYDDGAILGNFTSDPFCFSQPREIIRLGIIISKFIVGSINHLLDQSPSDTISFGTECDGSLYTSTGPMNFSMFKLMIRRFSWITETPRNWVAFMAE